ncbi:MAG: ABC transporter substrate-binding protein [Methylomonas sp.]|nr:ABC transporter substrate-binding protein [Methylomonas sp.]
MQNVFESSNPSCNGRSVNADFSPVRLTIFSVRALTFMLVIACLFNLIAIARAQAAEQPQAIIENASNQIRSRMQDREFVKNFDKVVNFVESVIDPHINFDLLSALVLGKYWKTASQPERATFKKEFKLLLLRTYSRVFVEMNDWDVEFLPAIEKNSGDKILVKTRVKQPGRQHVDVDYRMLAAKGQWEVYDILIDGVSLVNTYRSNFKYDIDSAGSIAPIIDKLVEKNAGG